MLFSNSLRTLPGSLFVQNISLDKDESTKFLGVYIDCNLSWKTHINYSCKLLSRNSGVLNKLKHEFLPHILLSLYFTLISSYLNYGIFAWGNGTKSLLDRILLLQKRAIRNINNAAYLSHTYPLFLKDKLLRISDLYIYI